MGSRSPEETEALVVRALTSFGMSQRAVGAELGVSGPCIGHIRLGVNHKHVREDLPRWRSCVACTHWWGGCQLGFPDPDELGDLWQAATECAAFSVIQPAAPVQAPAVDRSTPPPPNRIRPGDVWADIQGRKHLAKPCVMEGMLLMTPLDHDLVPLAMDVTRPDPWQRKSWGGQL
jgi:hypothetical protein